MEKLHDSPDACEITFSEGFIVIKISNGDGREGNLRSYLSQRGIDTSKGSFYSPIHTVCAYYILDKIRVISEGIPF